MWYVSDRIAGAVQLEETDQQNVRMEVVCDEYICIWFIYFEEPGSNNDC